MAKKLPLIEKISLKGLEIAPSQTWGAIRLVPLLRKQPRTDLRLYKREYDSDISVVSVKKDIRYISYVPHGLVLTWSDRHNPVAALGGQLLTEGKKFACGATKIELLQRMAKRETENSLRILPLHLAMEGFLSMFFGGPTIAWQDYSRQALSQGLSPRIEWSIAGRAIAYLEAALRIFEIHEHQVGVLLFVAETLASAFVVPTPEDYRALHTSLLQDFYGETFYYHGLYGQACHLETTIDEDKIHDFEDLEKALMRMRADWSNFQGFMARDLLNRSIQAKRIYTAGSFSLQRFITDLSLEQNNYIGEAIIDDLTHLQYLKIYGLSKAQTKRAYLLQQLDRHNWNLEHTAKAQKNTLEQLVRRMENLGFGYLINNQLREKCRKN
ncbi:MAG: hypothetical protein QNJ72_37375 [Pleurocapsa sp. MO_226.B13]|nr:hypothetical protein [Pleurocapsa sp. MO_226.B13]